MKPLPALALVLLAGCSGEAPAPEPSSTPPAPEPSHEPTPPAAPQPLPGADGQLPERVTFTEHVAPLIWARCGGCHRPGQVAPFPLLREDEIRDHAEQIARVTRTRYMPPWKPVRGHGEFIGDRSLTDAQIELLGRWVEQGMPSGPAHARREPPDYPAGWLGGEPDLVIELPEQAYELGAEGLDEYRNFVLPSPVAARRWVRAWELDPGNPRVVHHAILSVDRGKWARAQDEADPGPGFEAMEVRGAQSPGGFYLVWAPGSSPHTDAGAPTAWSLGPDMDLILQLHLQPSGKPEPVRPRVGLYLSEDPPTRPQLTMRLGDNPIDIAPGDAEYVLEDSLELPAPVRLLSAFPHAHYLARSVESRARLPDGSTRWLLHIDDWDFAWQDQYRYAEPLALPAGTVIELRIRYDNSAQNPRNPHAPPRRVQTGPSSTDEMGNLTFELLPADRPGLLALRERKYRRALRFEASGTAHYNLANVLRERGQLDAAEAEYRAAIEAEPTHLWSLHNLSMLLQRAGRFDEAVSFAQAEVELTPEAPAAHNNLGNALRGAGQREQALAAFRRALELDPGFELARNNLALMGEG